MPRELVWPLVATPPPGRTGKLKDIAAAMSFAVSSDAARATGSTIDVAGGLLF